MKKTDLDLFPDATLPAILTISRNSTSTACPAPTISISATESRSKFRRSIGVRRRVSPIGAEPGKPKEKPNDNEPRPQTETASQNEIIRITLDETQAAILAPILDKHRAATRITGLLAAVTRSFRPVAGCISVELQVLETDQRTIAALRKITGR
jgi:hypothetical protein